MTRHLPRLATVVVLTVAALALPHSMAHAAAPEWPGVSEPGLLFVFGGVGGLALMLIATMFVVRKLIRRPVAVSPSRDVAAGAPARDEPRNPGRRSHAAATMVGRPAPRMRFCTNCGERFADEQHRFCVACGHPAS